jgi:hypothetical protein
MGSDQSLSDIEAELEALRRNVRPASQHLISLAKPAPNASSSLAANLLGQVAGQKSIYSLLLLAAAATLRATPKLGASKESVPAEVPRSPVVNARTGLLLGVAGVMAGVWLSRVVPPTAIEQKLVAQYKPQIAKSIDEVLEASVAKAKTQLAEGFGLSRWIGAAVVLVGLAAQSGKLGDASPVD